MNPHIINIAGWLPAIIFPAATIIQLLALLRSNSIKGVSPMTWTLFGIANISVYIYTEKYLAVQMIVGFLGTALLDLLSPRGDQRAGVREVMSRQRPDPNEPFVSFVLL